MNSAGEELDVKATAVVKLRHETARQVMLRTRNGCRRLEVERMSLSAGKVASLQEALRKTESLEEVALYFVEGRQRLVDELVKTAAVETPHLTEFTLMSIRLRKTDALFDGLLQKGQLRSLSITANPSWNDRQLGLCCDELLPALATFLASPGCTLKNLWLNGYLLTGARMSSWVKTGLSRNTSIERLSLRRNKIDDDDVSTLVTGLERQPGLCIQSLDLSGNCIRETGGKRVGAYLKMNKSVKSAHLRWNSIGDNGVKGIANALLFQEHLIELDLSNTRISDASVPEIVQLVTRNKCLRYMQLSWNPSITNRGWEDLTGAFTVNQTCTSVGLLESSNPFEQDLELIFEQNREFPSYEKYLRDTEAINVWPELLGHVSSRPSWMYDFLHIVDWEVVDSVSRMTAERKTQRSPTKMERAVKRQRR